MLQEQAIQLMKDGKNIFLTGQGGTGKSYAVKQFIMWAKDTKKRISITGSTGMAALNIQGTTIHSWSGMGIDSVWNDDLEARLTDNKNLNKRLKSVQILVIDEVSMLHSKQIELLNSILKYVRKSEKPFGGLQIILIGDFFQLPPVALPSEKDSRYCFNSSAWEEANFTVCYLTKLYRQAEGDSLIGILNAIRDESFNTTHLDLLKSCVNNKLKSEYPLRLYATNNSVDEENKIQLDKLSTPVHTLKSYISGNELKAKQIMKAGNIPLELHLKVGAQIMITRNQTYTEYKEKYGDSVSYPNFIPEFVNGSQGVITEISPKFITIELLNGKSIVLIPFRRSLTETNLQGKEIEVAAVVYYPLRLAYAISIHKSQGQTFEEASIDLSNIFEEGQGYVALSRLKSISGLSISSSNINEKTIKINDTVRIKDKEFLQSSNEDNIEIKQEEEVEEVEENKIEEDPVKIETLLPTPNSITVSTTYNYYKEYINILTERGYTMFDIINEIEISIREHKLFMTSKKDYPPKSVLVHLDVIVQSIT